MGAAYLGALLLSIAGMVVLDARFRLFFWRSPWRAAAVLAIGVAFLLLWDLAGIALGLFLVGDSPFLTGLMLAPELTLEEPFFLVLLCYLTMNAIALTESLMKRRRA
ncbi:lycopene cyclase domain-containing protein [Rathayibacter sp. YIM 133350]|uniref:lycopene cyclase domain-containing protein n=1 Tax=Rathayibacter sp. YIM 133350 TaxID=3131992 RepID=UPI00307DD86E